MGTGWISLDLVSSYMTWRTDGVQVFAAQGWTHRDVDSRIIRHVYLPWLIVMEIG